MLKKFENRDWFAFALICFLILSAIASFLCCPTAPIFIEKLWTDKLTFWADLTTLAVAILLWTYGLRARFEGSLPKRMNIYFEHRGLRIMYCHMAELADVSDARAASQSIGREMLKKCNKDQKEDLDLISPMVSVKKSRICLTHVEYAVTIPLHTVPVLLQKIPAIFNEQQKAATGSHFLEWRHPFAEPTVQAMK